MPGFGICTRGTLEITFRAVLRSLPHAPPLHVLSPNGPTIHVRIRNLQMMSPRNHVSDVTFFFLPAMSPKSLPLVLIVCLSPKRGYRHNFCCHRDWASKTLYNLMYTNWNPDALWRTTMLSHQVVMCSIRRMRVGATQLRLPCKPMLQFAVSLIPRPCDAHTGFC
jgi:hypothetical protein